MTWFGFSLAADGLSAAALVILLIGVVWFVSSLRQRLLRRRNNDLRDFALWYFQAVTRGKFHRQRAKPIRRCRRGGFANNASPNTSVTSVCKLTQGGCGQYVNYILVRVPWHNNEWQGTVRKRPKDNGSCTVLPKIAEDKNEECEHLPDVRGTRVDKLEAPFTLTRHPVHPYKDIGTSHRDLQPTTLQQAPFSAGCIAFRWMRKEFADELAQGWRLNHGLLGPMQS